MLLYQAVFTLLEAMLFLFFGIYFWFVIPIASMIGTYYCFDFNILLNSSILLCDALTIFF